MSDDQPSPDGEHTPEGSDYVSDRAFADFPIRAETLKGILELGYDTATPVQAATIEPAVAGRDLLVRAKTGTGKTSAFCVPIVERCEDGTRTPQAVILAPTRELAQQIAEECDAIAKYRDLTLAVLVGGLPIGPQEKILADGAEIIVGTPGRILDHIRRKNLDLSGATMMCLDEADEMLSMGFFQDVTKIIDATAEDRQVLLYSATISSDTQRLVDKYLKDPESIRLSTDGDNVDSITHIVYETGPDMHRVRALLYLIDLEDPTSAIIFCNTREDTATVASFLDRQGLDVQLLSGELSQARRSQVMQKVKAGDVRFLVSTDVASRGIDISDLSHVINYSLPFEPPVYLHRTGRTGRIGKEGTAISLVGGPDLSMRRTLETVHNITFVERKLPDEEEAVRYRVDRQAKQIRAAMGKLVFESYLPTVRALKERPDGDALLAAALRAFFQWDRQRKIDMGKLDSVGELIQQRNDKMDKRDRRRKGDGDRDRGRRGERDRGRRSDGERPRSSDDRRGKSSSGRKKRDEGDGDVSELDALLLAAAPADDEPKKKKRRKRRKSSSDSESGGAPETKKVVDDLDALLIADG